MKQSDLTEFYTIHYVMSIVSFTTRGGSTVHYTHCTCLGGPFLVLPVYTIKEYMSLDYTSHDSHMTYLGFVGSLQQDHPLEFRGGGETVPAAGLPFHQVVNGNDTLAQFVTKLFPKYPGHSRLLLFAAVVLNGDYYGVMRHVEGIFL